MDRGSQNGRCETFFVFANFLARAQGATKTGYVVPQKYATKTNFNLFQV